MDDLLNSEKGFMNLQLSDIEMEALLQVLHFAKSAAGMLSQQAITQGIITTDALKMQRFASDAGELLKILHESIKIGEPKSHELN
jgi:predicted Rossmann-fold nucleotide-binding protein